MSTIRVLQVGDIAGVGTRLSAALQSEGLAEVRFVAPPMWFAGASRPWKQMVLPLRGAVLHWRVRRAARRWRPDVVHLHWARFVVFMPRHLRVVVHAHGSDVRALQSEGRSLLRPALKRAAAVLVATPDLRSIPGLRTQYVPNPVDTATFQPAGRSSIGRQRPRVLLFARLTRIKGADTLIEAARMLRSGHDEIPDVVAFAGGDGDQRAAAVGVELLPPARRPAEVAAVVCSCDVVIGQQALGTLGLSELEAMACGLPVLVRIRRELYDAEVPVLDTDDAESIVRLCRALIVDEAQRIELGARARRYVIDHHEPGRLAHRLREVYDDVMRAG